MPQPRWNTADLLDLEFLVQQDEGEDMARLAARDREIFAALPEQDDARLLRCWLEHRKQNAEKDSVALPGSLWQELTLLFALAAGLAGLISGGGLAFSFLAYSGSEPVNVAAYFAMFVLLQLGLYLLLAGSVLCSKWQGGNILTSSLLYRLAGRLFFWLLDKCLAAGRRTSSRISAEQRLSWAAHAGSVKSLRQRHGLLLLRPFFLLAQLFGISFNIGVLAATLLKVIGSDLAFGWQSTLQIDAAAVHALARWISLPWLWLPESVPTLAQIEGSRLILKDGIYHLASRDLASWWPFLCLAVFSYGLLPRLALLTCGLLQQRRDLAEFDPQQGRFRQILHRMRTPLVATAASAAAQKNAAAPLPEETAPPASELPSNEAITPVVVLLPDELYALCPIAALTEQIRQAGYQLRQTIPFWTLDKSEAEELAGLQAAMTAQGCKDVIILHEAWQPPVQELLTWLAGLRRALGPQALIRIALIGRPAADNLLTPPQPEQVRIWRQKTAALGDSGLQVLELC
ncbi:DUF2868 domain-containing protein [Candidatus Electronema sp. JM]|uniref:DUF2868 domain-containing protein n=1 Tax=Candidatus Electronema sp. JM TaxID=3401571 RepID=UPI003AA7DA76